VLNARRVKGVFFHSSAYMAVVFPFAFYFLKQRDYLWLGLLVLACAATGTRSPIFIAICLSPLAAKSVLSWRIRWGDVALGAVLIAAAYWFLITWTGTHEVTEDFDSRTSTGSLQWRIGFWQNFLVFDEPMTIWFGHGVGEADELATELAETRALGYMFAPHNDYLRLYYDGGLVGVCLFLGLVFSNLRRLVRSASEHDYGLLMYLLIIAFSITDNFVYFLYPLLAYTFIACCIPAPAAGEARSAEALSAGTAVAQYSGS
jgi:O-antigen ligase